MLIRLRATASWPTPAAFKMFRDFWHAYPTSRICLASSKHWSEPGAFTCWQLRSCAIYYVTCVAGVLSQRGEQFSRAPSCTGGRWETEGQWQNYGARGGGGGFEVESGLSSLPTPSPRPVILSLVLSLPSTETASYAGYISCCALYNKEVTICPTCWIVGSGLDSCALGPPFFLSSTFIRISIHHSGTRKRSCDEPDARPVGGEKNLCKSSKRSFSKLSYKREMNKWCSENWQYSHLSSE